MCVCVCGCFRCKRADLVSLLNQRVPEECLNHMTHYKEASESTGQEEGQGGEEREERNG